MSTSLPEGEHIPSSLADAVVYAILERHGYRWSCREQGFVECLVTRQDERWLGRGLTAREALDDALRLMLPSALARAGVFATSLPESLANLRPASADAARAPVRDVPAEPVAPVVQPIVQLAPVAVAPVAVAAPAVAPVAPVVVAPAPVEAPKVRVYDPNDPNVVHIPDPPSPSAEPAPVRRTVVLPTPINKARSDEDVLELEVLEERLRALLPELAGFARDIQRLGFIAFIARARHVATRSGDPRVENVVRRIAGRLGELAEQFWPGSVKALQIRATPLQAGADMGLADGGRIHDWSEAAEIAERLVEEKRAKNDLRGLDDWGWADYDRCYPPPNDPDERLEAVRASMEKLFGRLEMKSSSDCDRDLQTAGDKLAPELVKWARELRWIRPHVEDRVRWGQAIGRLRWAAMRLPREHRGPLDIALDESHRPSKPWAHELGEDPIAKQKKKVRKALLQGRPTNEKATPDAVSEWLNQAFELGDAFTTSEIAERIMDWAPLVVALPNDEASGKDRKYRRRLKGLQDEIERRLRGEPEQPEVAATEEEPEAVSLDTDEGDLAFRKLLDRVREKVAGKLALFVSNRADPQLKEKLEKELGFEIEWAEIDPRRIQSRIESVRQGTYDLVLSATGFQGHSIDATLGRETKACGLPYVRVNRGRLTTTVRALARQFGFLDAA